MGTQLRVLCVVNLVSPISKSNQIFDVLVTRKSAIFSLTAGLPNVYPNFPNSGIASFIYIYSMVTQGASHAHENYPSP